MTKTKKNSDNLFVDGFQDSPDEDVTSQLKQLWDDVSREDCSDYKLQLQRLEPQTYKGLKIVGYLETFYLPVTIPDIIEKVGLKYGGGKYQIRIVDGVGKYVKSKTFEIAGLPKLPEGHQSFSNSHQEPNDGQPIQSLQPVTDNTWETKELPSKDEIKEMLIRRSLTLLDRAAKLAPDAGESQVPVMRFLKELYGF